MSLTAIATFRVVPEPTCSTPSFPSIAPSLSTFSLCTVFSLLLPFSSLRRGVMHTDRADANNATLCALSQSPGTLTLTSWALSRRFVAARCRAIGRRAQQQAADSETARVGRGEKATPARAGRDKSEKGVDPKGKHGRGEEVVVHRRTHGARAALGGLQKARAGETVGARRVR